MNTLKILALASIVGASALSATADQPEGYYAATAGKKKAELKSTLHGIIRTASVLNYGSGAGKTWSGFYYTDRDEDGYCIDRYSPEMRQFTSTTGAISGMNIEHSFAKSWWGGSQVQAYKDLFNLMPSDQKANSSKSNFAMGEVTNAPSTTDWESLDADFPDAPTSGWTKEKASGDISLKAYAGRRICLAFHYTSTTSACYGWEVRNVQVNGTMGTTGIEDIPADKEDVRPADNDRVYDLTGRPLRWSEAKGVVIFKGKLYVK